MGDLKICAADKFIGKNNGIPSKAISDCSSVKEMKFYLKNEYMELNYY